MSFKAFQKANINIKVQLFLNIVSLLMLFLNPFLMPKLSISLKVHTVLKIFALPRSAGPALHQRKPLRLRVGHRSAQL